MSDSIKFLEQVQGELESRPHSNNKYGNYQQHVAENGQH